MSFKLFGLAVLSIIFYTSSPIQAGVLRTDTTANLPTEQPLPTTEFTTIAVSAGDDALSRDEDATIKIAVASLDPAPDTAEDIEITLETVDNEKAKSEQSTDEEKKLTDESKRDEDEVKNESAFSRDEAASIKVKAHESDDLTKDIPLSSAESAAATHKSSKLLLLSTPRLAREQEENIAEPEDVDINTAVSTDETTELSIEIQTETEKSSEEKDEPTFLTRVRDAIFGKKTDDETTKPTADKKEVEHESSTDVEKQDKVEIKKDDAIIAPAATAEQSPEPHNDNAATAVLIEAEPDYVLFDSGVEHLEHLGSFTHVDSDEHLQPIVHSVEVVPSHFEEPLLFTSSYVHAW